MKTNRLPEPHELDKSWFHGAFSYKATLYAIEVLGKLQEELAKGAILFMENEPIANACVVCELSEDFSLGISTPLSGDGTATYSFVGDCWNATSNKIYITKAELKTYFSNVKIIHPANFVNLNQLVKK